MSTSDAVDGRRDRQALGRGDPGVHRLAIAPLGEGRQLVRESVAVVANERRRRGRLDQLAESGHDLGEPGPITADRRRAVKHGVVVDRAPDLGEGDDHPAVLGVDGDLALLEAAQRAGEGEARIGPSQAADIDPADHDAGQDPIDVRLPEGDQPAEHQRDAQECPEHEASGRATRSRDTQRPDRRCELASDGHRVITKHGRGTDRRVKGGSLHDRSRAE